MLEGLARLYSHLNNKKKFAKLEKHFKRLEDALGSIDYYDGFRKEFANDAAIAEQVKQFVGDKVAEKTSELNDVLEKKDWTGKHADRLAKIRKRLGKIDWLGEKDEVDAIEKYYKDKIADIDDFYGEHSSGFTDLESQVHELRRKLRWLSIFPQALQGCIQLTAKPSRSKDLVKYLTPEIVNSPFNKLPEAGKCRYVFTLERDRFYALSWMIAELGRLKDSGLRIQLLREAGVTSVTDAAANADILIQASAISSTFFGEKNLDHLVAGVVERRPE